MNDQSTHDESLVPVPAAAGPDAVTEASDPPPATRSCRGRVLLSCGAGQHPDPIGVEVGTGSRRRSVAVSVYLSTRCG